MTMMLRATRALVLSAAAAALPLSVGHAQQTTAQPDTIWACYVPTSGTMYRIRVADTKADCTGNGIAFAWNAKGPKGDTGEKGEKGDKGDKGDVGPQGPPGTPGTGGSAFQLPYNGSASTAGSLFNLTNTDGGNAASFNSGGTSPTVFTNYTGTGNTSAMVVQSLGNVAALAAVNNGTGVGPALRAANNSAGTTVNIQNSGTGTGLNINTTSGLGINLATGGNGININTTGQSAINATLNNTAGGGAISANSNGRFATIDTRHSGSSNALFAETQNGSAATFHTVAGSESNSVLNASNDGPGNGIFTSSKGNGATLFARNDGPGIAGSFNITNAANNAFALWAATSGTGAAIGGTSVNMYNTIYASNTGDGGVIHGDSKGSQPSIFMKNTGSGFGASFMSNTGTTLILTQTGGGTGNGALQATSAAQNTGWFENTGTGNNIAVGGRSFGVWPTAQFENARAGGGVALRTFGDADIHGNFTVSGNSQVMGTKNAIVPTSSGLTKVYSEESTELWFTDYGEAQLVDGIARVRIDSKFAETVDLSVKYLVFVQANDDATLYVPTRTAQGFEVKVRDGSANATFSYRIVAKRKGYATERLAPADKR